MTALLPALILAATQAAPAPPAACPAAVGGVGLKSFEVFDGPIAENVILAPTGSRKRGRTTIDDYAVDNVYREGRKLTLRCHYGPRVTRTVPIARAVKLCQSESLGNRTTLSCR